MGLGACIRLLGPCIRPSSIAALQRRAVGMVGIVLTATARHFGVPIALARGRMADVLLRPLRIFPVLMRSAGPGDALRVRMFVGHKLTVLLVSLVGGVLFNVSLLALLRKVLALRQLAVVALYGSIGLRILGAATGSWNWNHLRHDAVLVVLENAAIATFPGAKA
jgi:hypothetical protein